MDQERWRLWSRTACQEKRRVLWTGHNRAKSWSPQPWCYSAITVMLPDPLLSPAAWARHALGCALAGFSVHAHTTVLILLPQDWTKGNCLAHHCQASMQKQALLSLLPEEPRPMDLPHARNTGRKYQGNQCSYLHTHLTFSWDIWDIFIELRLTLLALECHHRLSAAASFSFELFWERVLSKVLGFNEIYGLN